MGGRLIKGLAGWGLGGGMVVMIRGAEHEIGEKDNFPHDIIIVIPLTKVLLKFGTFAAVYNIACLTF